MTRAAAEYSCSRTNSSNKTTTFENEQKVKKSGKGKKSREEVEA